MRSLRLSLVMLAALALALPVLSLGCREPGQIQEVTPPACCDCCAPDCDCGSCDCGHCDATCTP